jgi:selenocysteine-specific translation elongation factor
MAVLNVLCVSTEDFARNLGKRTDDRDVESYIYKEIRNEQSDALTFLRPRKHPERIRPLLAALDIADAGIIQVQRIDATLGEVLVASAVAGLRNGIVVIEPEEGGWVDPDQLSTIIKQAGLNGWTIMSTVDVHAIRDYAWNFLDTKRKNSVNSTKAPLAIPVDQNFSVKGVGLVAIGTVQTGVVNKHDNLVTAPGKDTGVVRSLQVMDDDVDVASAGDRVGVAIRNMKENALSRGTILTRPEDIEHIMVHSCSSIQIETAPFQKRSIEQGTVVHASIDLQFVVGRCKEVGERIHIDWDAPLLIRNGASRRLILSQLDAGSMRILGHVTDIQAN